MFHKKTHNQLQAFQHLYSYDVTIEQVIFMRYIYYLFIAIAVWELNAYAENTYDFLEANAQNNLQNIFIKISDIRKDMFNQCGVVPFKLIQESPIDRCDLVRQGLLVEETRPLSKKETLSGRIAKNKALISRCEVEQKNDLDELLNKRKTLEAACFGKLAGLITETDPYMFTTSGLLRFMASLDDITKPMVNQSLTSLECTNAILQ
jgi:hypothetical protein